MIEKMNSTPLYLQLKNKIKREIRTGILKPGDKIPSEAQLQKEYGMSRVTVRNAMEELTVEGYIIKVQGKGSFVAQSDMLRLPIGVTSFTEDAKMQGVSLTSKVIKAGIEEIHVAPELADIHNENLAGSFYDILMNKYHMIPANKGRRSVKIIFADADTAEHLEVSQGTPIIESEMCVFDVNGEPIHTVKDLVRGDNDRFMKWYV